MPAYRSAAEAEIRDAVVSRLRQIRPHARIIHEIQSACQGPNRFDLVAVSRSEIIAVEIKSQKDKLDRLPAQITAMHGSAHRVIAALHEKFLRPMVVRGEPNPGALLAPAESRGAIVWCYPEAGTERGRTYGVARWEDPKPAIMTPLPHGGIDMLWHGELWRLAADLGLTVQKSATRPQMIAVIRWRASGEAITKGVCAALRRRQCVEADPAVEEAA
jgi:hypothetical protein